MNNQGVSISLSRDEAVVLFDFLCRNDPPTDNSEDPCVGGRTFVVADHSEERVLWTIEAQLEKVLVEPLDPNWAKILKVARSQVRGTE